MGVPLYYAVSYNRGLPPVSGNEDVLRFQVPVDDSVAVKEVDSRQNLRSFLLSRGKFPTVL